VPLRAGKCPSRKGEAGKLGSEGWKEGVDDKSGKGHGWTTQSYWGRGGIEVRDCDEKGKGSSRSVRDVVRTVVSGPKKNLVGGRKGSFNQPVPNRI